MVEVDNDWWRGCVIYQVYPRSFQDTNGDGIPDSPLRILSGLATQGKIVQYAVRIIDNCGMINVNTAWKRNFTGTMSDLNYARSMDVDSYGEYLHQIDFYRLLKRTGLNDANTLTQAINLHT